MEPDPGISDQKDVTTSSSPTVAADQGSSMTMEKAQIEHEKEQATPLPAHDSMVTVRLSEPPSLSVNTDLPPNTMPSRRSVSGRDFTPTSAVAATPTIEEETMPEDDGGAEPEAHVEPKNLMEELQESAGDGDDDADDGSPDEDAQQHQEQPRESMGESDEDEVNWDKLQKTEDEHAQDNQDDNSTAMLLARLEEENNKLATNPKGVKVKVVEQPTTRRPRPPSMAQLRDMVHGPTPVALRYSVLPPPPMTDLEFYVALVKDYQQTAARLPTLLSKKIRSGIPPPLRGVVWQSMAGARDTALLETFDRLCGESSPYEGLIGKDLGRSFPGVDMFRDPEGEGQRMLGRVLKCFSLYDQKIGYCQGLAFLVGPLLMHMPDNQAFCVLVRLMEHYDLRACFLPDLSGLHVRIYQFRELLRQNLPNLSAHLDQLQVDPAYVSQWFLSFFAVTCPLPMLFRIYDVIFAEGASETIMRVALSLMRKNETRIMACSEMEDVMQLLLSRGLWDCYHYNADEFVDDFVSLSNVVSREKLAQLEQNYREAQIATANAARTSDVTTAASRFLGRLWTTSTTSPKTLSPGLNAPSRPLSMLRRSTSKQSLASTLNSMETSSASVLSSASTDATTISRDSANTDVSSIRESTPVASKQNVSSSSNISGIAAENKALHSQIEDLLTAFSELQRNQALLATQLQREREERDEARKSLKSLMDGLNGTNIRSSEQLAQLMDEVENRFGLGEQGEQDNNNSTNEGSETKEQLREELARTKEQLSAEMSKYRDFNRRIDELGSEAQNLKDQLRDSHAHVRSLHQDKQRLEKQVFAMRARASETPQSSSLPISEANGGNGWLATAASLASAAGAAVNGVAGGGVNSSGGGAGGGLRELKLARSKSTPTTDGYSKRTSSVLRTQTDTSSHDNDALLVELAQAKTAEAVARQEAEEYKQKLESFKRAHGITSNEAPTTSTASAAATAAMGMFGRLATAVNEASTKNSTASAPPAIGTPGTPTPTAGTGTPSTNSGGFWGWRR